MEEAVASFKAVTNTQDDAVARELLSANDWSVEAAVASIYDDKAQDPPDLPQRDSLDIDYRPRQSVSQIGIGSARRFLAQPFNLVMLPINFLLYILSSIVAFGARLVGLRPNLPSFSLRPLFASSGSTISRLDPRQCAERLVRELEEETGASSSYGTSSGVETSTTTVHPVASTSKASSSGSTGRDSARNKLPNFHIGSYESALSLAKDKLCPLCVILISAEHQDTDEFKRTTVVDPDLVATFEQRHFVVWIGDIKYADAYQTSKVLEATTYPFFAFITMQPPRATPGTLQTSNTPKMSVFSRLEGPPSSVTSANAIISHINSTFIPRTSSYLDRLRREKASRDHDRQMRQEQERAYAEAGRRDVERIRAKQAAIEAERLEKERVAQLAKDDAAKRELAAQWRAWARKNLVPAEPPTTVSASETARLSVKLPDGRRLIRKFRKTDTLHHVYAWVDCEALSPSDAEMNAGAANATKPARYQHQFGFELVSMFPRKTLDKSEMDATLESLGGLVPDASLAVEGMKLGDQEDSSSSDSE